MQGQRQTTKFEGPKIGKILLTNIISMHIYSNLYLINLEGVKVIKILTNITK